jgi:hypothetical protein
MAEVEEIKQTPDIQEINTESYQHLFEGKVEVLVEDKEKLRVMNISHLLRNLYQKIYEVEAKLDKLSPKN